MRGRWTVIPMIAILLWVNNPVPSFSTGEPEPEPEPDKDVLVALDQTRESGERIEAIRRLSSFDTGNALGTLTEILLDKSEEEGVRACAARALGESKTARAEVLGALEEVLKEPGAGSNLRCTILLSLGSMKDERALRALTEALDDSDSMIRFKAVQAMGNLGLVGAISYIGKHLEAEKDKMVRAQAARALGRYDTDMSQSCLARLLTSDPDALVRFNAALSLLKFSSLKPNAQSALNSAAEDDSIMVRDALKGVTP